MKRALQKEYLEKISNKEKALGLKIVSEFKTSDDLITLDCPKHGPQEITIKYFVHSKYGCPACSREGEFETKRKNCLAKYGTEHYFQSEDKKRKTRETFQKRYGVDAPAQVPEIAKKMAATRKLQESSEITKRMEATTLKRYGVKNAAQSEEVKARIRKTCLEVYGKTSALACPEVRAKRNLRVREKLIEERSRPDHIKAFKEKIFSSGLYEVVRTQENPEDPRIVDYVIRCNHCRKEFVWNEFIYTNTRTNYSPYCHDCVHRFSKEEKIVFDYVRSIYGGEVLSNDRRALDGKELDVYLPDLKLGIEYNGIFWHGFHKKSKHSVSEIKRNIVEKRELCKSKGIRLISIDDIDWNDRPDVFKRFLKDQILPRRRVGARECEVVEVSTSEAKKFCKEYHVNGFRGGSRKIGLKLGDELLVLAIFAKLKDQHECIRLCFKTGVDVIGGWKKIQSHFGEPFLHYVNLKYFEGEDRTGIGYRFVSKKTNQVLHRNSLQKKTGLFKHCPIYDPNLSDFQNCVENDFICVFDMGNDIRWYNKKEAGSVAGSP
jgi:hypothetical protein